MKNLFTLFFLLISLSSFASPDTLYYCEHKNGINGAWLLSRMTYTPDPANPEFTQEVWEKQQQEFLSQLKSVSCDNSSAIVLELMRCPNSRHDKPRYKVQDGAIVPTEDVLDVTIPPGYSGVNPDGTLIPN